MTKPKYPIGKVVRVYSQDGSMVIATIKEIRTNRDGNFYKIRGKWYSEFVIDSNCMRR